MRMPKQPAAQRRPIGAHAPVSGGLATGSLRYAAAVGAEAIQIFVTNPRAWIRRPIDGEQAAALRQHVNATGLPVFVHAPYLINVGSPDAVVRERSAASLWDCLERGQLLAARGVIVHVGSAITADRAAAIGRMKDTLAPLLDKLPDDGPDLLLEPMAGQGQMLCAVISDLGPYLAALDWHPRANLCLDTCHLFAAGHDLTADGGVASLLAELSSVAAGRLRLVHANDSKDPCGSNKDRHENIGRGSIGNAAFRALLQHPATDGVTFVVETPGGEPGQRKDIATLKTLRRGPPKPRDPRLASLD